MSKTVILSLFATVMAWGGMYAAKAAAQEEDLIVETVDGARIDLRPHTEVKMFESCPVTVKGSVTASSLEEARAAAAVACLPELNSPDQDFRGMNVTVTPVRRLSSKFPPVFLIAFTCQRGCTPGPGNWTPWLDRDNPSGDGDFETLKDFIDDDKACPAPTGVECRVKQGTIGVHTCTLNGGLVCRNGEDPDSSCADYEVRFFCPGWGWPPL